MKLPRKMKKGLKKALITMTKGPWKTHEVKLIKTERRSKHRDRMPTFKGLTCVSYTLGY